MDYKDTLNLPKTDFPMKANLAQKEPEMLKKWEESKIYDKIIEKTKKNEKFFFHDGPPYANGALHLGTMLNKILKDIVVKYKNMSGFGCEFVPGWDCHGLPIELGVDKKLGPKRKEMSSADVRKECRKHADHFMNLQREGFKRLGCFGRWQEPYLTMNYAYEANIAREFGKFVENNSVYKAKKPIYWCSSCTTALADAEVEYYDHTAPSIYVKFKLEDDSDFRKEWKLGNEPIYLVIWTTTPWTIPANLAIALHPDLPYVALKVDNEVWVIAEGLIDSVMKAVNKNFSLIVGKPKPSALEHKKCKHPLINRSSLIILGDHVTLEAGTGAVHTAPGHGQEDYEVGLRYGLDILAPVDNRGRFTKECEIDWLVGKGVEESNIPIVDALNSNGSLIKSENISHSYPHCWRCKKPIIFRSTEQWFISLSKNDLRKKALDEISKVNWIPHWGENRIRGMLEVRPDWCVSRQRLWGVPIPAVVCKKCETSYLDPKIIKLAVEIFEKESSDAWYIRDAGDFIPKGFKCEKCGSEEFGQEKDILDVWFDSGVSFASVMERMLGIKDQVDLYLEGSDQHRGWFHTSLLTSVGTRNRAPYKSVLTHGFVVDGEGKKLSKSAGNYLPPEQVMAKYGAEIVRLWAASEDYKDDIRFSEEIMSRTVESYRKIRNTCRFILGNLFDFTPEKALSVNELRELDKYTLYKLSRLTEKILKAYEEYEFHTIQQAINQFATVDLSAFYLDILKDCLYADHSSWNSRLSAQTVLWHIINDLVRLIAPIYSFTADEVWQYLPGREKLTESVFLNDLPKPLIPKDEDFENRWNRFKKIRAVATKALEEARASKLIGNSLEAKITIDATNDDKAFLNTFENLSDLIIVSEILFEKLDDTAFVSPDKTDIKIKVEKTSGNKCPRCWKYTPAQKDDICDRCKKAVGEK